MKFALRVCLAGVFVAIVAAGAFAQESRSAALAKQLAAALDAAKLDSIAAKDPSGGDIYVGALYFPNFQLLVVSGTYSAPVLLDQRITKKEYRDVYIDLNSASPAASRILIEDLGADGLKAKREENSPFDTFNAAGKSTAFDSDWKKQKLSEEDYMKAFGTADARYAQILTALLAQAKK